MNEYAGTGNRIQVASKEVQRERAIARIQRTTFEDLEPSFQARREDAGSGYADAHEWWESMKTTYGLEDELKPDWVDSAPIDPVVDFVRDYRGTSEFILSLQDQVKRGRMLSPKQYAAAERNLAKPKAAEVPATDDPVIQFVLTYEGDFEFLLSLQKQLKQGRTLSERQYGGARKCFAKRRSDSPEGKAAATEGMYRTSEGRIFKVQRAVNGSGNLYAKELKRDVAVGNVFGAVDQGRWKFVYSPGTIRKLRLEDKMTVDQAREFGALYGTCMICGRTLTDETSIAHGIGPICEGRMTEWM